MRGHLCVLLSATLVPVAAPLLAPRLAYAGSFSVSACDAAPGGAHSSWLPQAGSVDVFKICPSSNLPGFGGIGTRMVGRTFRSGEYSRQWFYAPSGTTITGLTWSGGYNHDCTGGVWANQLRAQGRVDVVLEGTSPGPLCQPSREVAPPSFRAVPAGTTRLLENTQCGAATCPSSGAAFRIRYAVVIINDPTPPAVNIVGGGLSGANGWVRGHQVLTAVASDVTGIKLVRMQVSGYSGVIDSGKSCNFTVATPCTLGNGGTTLGVRTTELTGGPHVVTVTAYDAASNATSRSATVKVDNSAPPEPAPALDGGSGWRSSNAYTLRWATPEHARSDRAPITGVRYSVCPVGSTLGCTTRTVSESFPTDVSPKAPGEGEFDVRVALVDAAGNGASADARWSEPVRLRYDPDRAQLRAGIVKSTFKRKRIKVGGKRRTVGRRVVRLVQARRVRHGRRFEVRGMLTSHSGQPRVNTAVAVYGRSNRLGAPESHLGWLRTDTGGRFIYRAVARQSHSLRFTRRASTATVEVRVPGRLTFRARPRSVINGEAVTFRGRVLGEIPPEGKQVVIQAYSRGRWRTFQLLRTDARGRYSHVYRFDGTRGKVVYPLRAGVTRESTFAYEPARSRVRRVTVRGL